MLHQRKTPQETNCLILILCRCAGARELTHKEHRVYAGSLISWSISYLSSHLSPHFQRLLRKAAAHYTCSLSQPGPSLPRLPFSFGNSHVHSCSQAYCSALGGFSKQQSHLSPEHKNLPASHPFLTFSGFKIDSCLFERIGLV